MVVPPGGAQHRTGLAKLRARAQTFLWVASDNVEPLMLAGDDLVAITPTSAGLAPAASSGPRRGARKKDKCRWCSQRGKACGSACTDWPGHALAATASSTTVANTIETATATAVATPAAAASETSTRRVRRRSNRLVQARRRTGELS